VKHPDHGLHRVAGFAKQLGSAGDPGEIDDSLQVGCAACPKLAREVLPADRQPAGENGGAHGPFYFTE
jgi:hypothetical protein